MLKVYVTLVALFITLAVINLPTAMDESTSAVQDRNAYLLQIAGE